MCIRDRDGSLIDGFNIHDGTFTVNGNVKLGVVNQIATDTNKFLMVDDQNGNEIMFVTGSTLRSYIGALQSSDTIAHANNLNATDDRDIAPEDISYSSDFRIYFADKSGLEGGTVGSNYQDVLVLNSYCLLYTSPSPRDKRQSRMPSSAWKKKKK